MWKNQTTPDLRNWPKNQFLQKKTNKQSNDNQQKSTLVETDRQLFALTQLDKNSIKSVMSYGKRNYTPKNLIIKQASLKTMELEENGELQKNLDKAEKTIKDLYIMVKSFKNQMADLLSMKQKIQGNSAISNQQHNQQIWKNNYSELIQHLDTYTKNVTLLVDQYRILQKKTQKYKKLQKNTKKSEKKLQKILEQSNNKLQKSQQIIQKLLSQIKQKDNKIQQYQIYKKNINIQIIQQRNLFDKYKKQIKFDKYITTNDQDKDTINTLKLQLQNINNLCKQYKIQINNWEILSQKYQNNQIKLISKIKQLEQLLQQSKITYDKLKQQKISLQHKIIQKQKLLQFNQSLQNQLIQQQKTINQIKSDLHNFKNQYNNMEDNLLTKIQQKDRQIQYLQQLKQVNSQKNIQFKKQLNEIRNDLITVVNELKNKQLQIKKMKQCILSSSQNNHANQQLITIIQNTNSSKSILSNQKYSSDEEDKDKKLLNCLNIKQGLVWKELTNSNAGQSCKTISQQSISTTKHQHLPSKPLPSQTLDKFPNLRLIKKQVLPKQQKQNKIIMRESSQVSCSNDKNSGRQSSELTYSNNQNSDSQIHLTEIKIQDNFYHGQNKTFSSLDSQRNRFNLHAFQHKLIIQDNSRESIKYGKISFR